MSAGNTPLTYLFNIETDPLLPGLHVTTSFVLVRLCDQPGKQARIRRRGRGQAR